MSSYTRFCADIVFPLHERLKGHSSVAIRERLEASQWGAPADIESEQAQRLNAFLVEIGARVPYYRDLFRSVGFDPVRATSVRSLQALPVLRKEDIRANTDALKAVGHGPLTRYNTGGSSGEPLVFFTGKARKSHDVAAKWRATRWWGVDIGDSEMVVWGSPIELGAQDRLRKVRDGVIRSHLLPAFNMSEASLDRFIASLRARRPKMLFGYPSALAHIARHAEQHGIALDNLGIEVAFVTAERLYDRQREDIARVFGCRVANGYGGRDSGFIAHECPAGGMHISAEDIVVELLDSNGAPVAPGTAGEVVVTHLASGDFPFVRYRTDDVAVLEETRCACGRGLPMLREIQGRTTDFVVAADGTVMHGLALIYIVRDRPGIKAFKIVQQSHHLTRVEIVPGPTYAAADREAIVSGMKQRLGADVQIQIDPVDEILPEASGKHRYVVSHALATR
jgi:phenylacetate-CoA ligase